LIRRIKIRKPRLSDAHLTIPTRITVVGAPPRPRRERRDEENARRAPPPPSRRPEESNTRKKRDAPGSFSNATRRSRLSHGGLANHLRRAARDRSPPPFSTSTSSRFPLAFEFSRRTRDLARPHRSPPPSPPRLRVASPHSPQPPPRASPPPRLPSPAVASPPRRTRRTRRFSPPIRSSPPRVSARKPPPSSTDQTRLWPTPTSSPPRTSSPILTSSTPRSPLGYRSPPPRIRSRGRIARWRRPTRTTRRWLRDT